jgi:ComEC/Rec2-related protein
LARWLRTPLPLRMSTPRAGAIAAMLAAFGYCLLAGMGVPAQRTLLMLSTVAIARLTDRNVPASLSLCWAAAVVAVVDPWAVMSAGFWLSHAHGDSQPHHERCRRHQPLGWMALGSGRHRRRAADCRGQ